MSPSAVPSLDQIARLLDKSHPQVALVVGAGIGIEATGQSQASWLGLLQHGIRHLVATQLQADRGRELEASLNAAFASSPFQLESALAHADLVEHSLKTPNRDAFDAWLKSAFAGFTALSDKRGVLESIRDIEQAGALILTTNYDNLLEDVTGLPAVTWEDHADFHRVITGQTRGILHIHGYWASPSSVVLGRSSYERVVADTRIQELLSSLWLKWSWVYVGCGDGLDDPNLGRLLEWSKKWGDSALPDFFLARKDKAKQLADRPDKPRNLFTVGYPGHEDLQQVLRSITPSALSAPFERVNDQFGQFRPPGSGIPFPSRAEYLAGEVPAFAADAEVQARLDTHGWACVLDAASVGKTTLALRVATAANQRDSPVYYLDLARDLPEYDVSTPAAGLQRLVRRGTLVILDNCHHHPELARQLWQQWQDMRPDGRGRLLIVTTRVQQTTVLTPAEDLTFFEKHPTNPAIQLELTPADLGAVAKHIYRRLTGSSHALTPEPPPGALADWHRDYRAALNAFTFAVSSSAVSFKRGDWALPVSRASAWVRRKWLDDLDPADRENLICLSVFGERGLELFVPVDVLPSPRRVDRLMSLELVTQARGGAFGQDERVALREPGWGKLILGALDPPVDQVEIRFKSALRSSSLADALCTRLALDDRRGETERLWDFLDGQRDAFVSRLVASSAPRFMRLLQHARAMNKHELVDAAWSAISRDADTFVEWTESASLDEFALLLDVAERQQRNTHVLWAALEDRRARFLSATRKGSLQGLARFLGVAKRHGRDLPSWWAAVDQEIDDFKRAVLSGQSFRGLVTFLQVARDHRTNAEPYWKVIESHRELIVARIWAGSLDFVAPFFELMEDQGRDVDAWWDLLASDEGKLTESALASSLDAIGGFLNIADRQGRDTKGFWKLLEGHFDRLAATAAKGTLDQLGSFLKTAQEQNRETDLLWDALRPKEFATILWSTPLDSLGSFLDLSERQGRDTSSLWEAIESQRDKLAAGLWSAPLRATASFVRRAKAQGRNTDLLWEVLAKEPLLLAQKGLSATLNDLVTIASHAPTTVLAIVVRDITPAHWSHWATTTRMDGAIWLSRRCRSVNRHDLADALVTMLLQRKNSFDFPPVRGGFPQVCMLLADVPESAAVLVDPFLTHVCTPQWLGLAYANAPCRGLAHGLRQLALHQPRDRRRHFFHSRLPARLHSEAAGFPTASPNDQAQIVQLLGAATFYGLRVQPSRIAAIEPAVLSELLIDAQGRRSDAPGPTRYQAELWIGVRSFASITNQTILMPVTAIEQALALWRAYLNESTTTMPDTVAHRVNEEMVAWLEDCVEASPPAIRPSRKPLARLVREPGSNPASQL